MHRHHEPNSVSLLAPSPAKSLAVFPSARPFAPHLGARPLSSRLLLGLALGLSLLCYAQVWRFNFVYDDDYQIINNANIQSRGHLRHYFTSPLWANAGGFDHATSYYRPLFLVWLRLNYALFKLNPACWHASSLALHLLAVWLAYLAALRLLALAAWNAGSRRATAAVAALIFALHPAHAEPVAWLSAASELLLAIFFLLAFVAYAASRSGGKRPWVAISLVSFALALLAKETAIVFMLLVLGCELARAAGEASIPRRLGRGLVSSLPWSGIAVSYLLVRRAVLGSLGHTQARLEPAVVLKTLPELLWFYARHLFWPWRLAEFYDVFYVNSARSREFVVPALATTIVVLALVAWARRSRAALMASLWILLPLLPVLDVALLRFNALVADRYLYLPSFGFCVLAGVLLVRLTEMPQLRRWSLAIVLIPAAVMGAFAARQLAPWENDLLLYENAVAVAPHNAFARTSLATQLILRSENERALRLLEESYAIDSYSWMTAFNLGYLEFSLGDLPQAERFFRRAIWLDPHNRNQFLMLGLTQKRRGNFAAAAATLEKTAEIWPDAPLVHLSLGEALERQGRYDQARAEYEKELSGQDPAAARGALTRLASR